MAKEILVEHGDRKRIKETFNVTYPTIKQVLRYKSNTLLAEKIRRSALSYGGRLIEY